jgi:hypothetical protein
MNPNTFRAKRKGGAITDADIIFMNKPLPIRIWLKLWATIYYVVSILTYVGMIAGVTATAYWSFKEFDWQRAIIGGLCTLLIIYVNRMNPKSV